MSKAVYFFCADSAKDPVANNVFERLTQFMPLTETNIEIDGLKILEHTDSHNHLFQFVRTKEVLSHYYSRYLPFLWEYFSQFDFAGIVNWHEGTNAPDRILTVHSTGDVSSGVFGNANPMLFKNLLVEIDKKRIQHNLDDFITSTEATHWSGIPYQGNPEWITDYNVPAYDIEIGSSENSWKNETAARVLASSLTGVFSNCVNESYLYTLLCLGGVHFEKSFSDAILSQKHPLSIGHILPNQWLVSGNYGDENTEEGLEKLERGITSVIGGIHAVVFHDNLKSVYKQLCKAIGEKYNVPVFKHKVLRDLDRTIEVINGS